jgi:hypothetical protein
VDRELSFPWLVWSGGQGSQEWLQSWILVAQVDSCGERGEQRCRSNAGESSDPWDVTRPLGTLRAQ